jgi:hypothetical protein
MEMENTGTRKQRYHFTEEADVMLLKEVLGDEGIFTSASKKKDIWDKISLNLNQTGIPVTALSIQRRLKRIHEEYLEKKKETIRASGIEEIPTEKDQLLLEYDELLKEEAQEKENKKKENAEKVDQDTVQGQIIREAALSSIATPSEEATKKRKSSVNDQLENYTETYSKMKRMEMRIRRREIEQHSHHRFGYAMRRNTIHKASTVYTRSLVSVMITSSSPNRDTKRKISVLLKRNLLTHVALDIAFRSNKI